MRSDKTKVLCVYDTGKYNSPKWKSDQWTKMFQESESERSLCRTGTGRSELAISVGRKQLGAQLECKADNEAVPSPLTSAIQVW